MAERFTILVEEGEEGYLLSDVVELPGCHTQAKTEEELMKRTREAIELCLKEHPHRRTKIRVQQLEV